MSDEVVKVDLLDGSCFTASSTLEQLNIAWAMVKEPGLYYIGRSKAEFEYVLDLVRDGCEEMQDLSYLEAMFLYGLFKSDPERVVLLNVGGIMFHLREAVAHRIPYLDSVIRWHEDSPGQLLLDYSSLFLDRNPNKFQKVLSYIEVYGSNVANLSACRKEATFFGVLDDKNLCFVCRKAPICRTCPMHCPNGHQVCQECIGHQKCKVCFETLLKMEHSVYVPCFDDHEQMREANATLEEGNEDMYLTHQPMITIHQNSHRKTTKSAFTYKSMHFHQSEKTLWTLDIQQCCDLLGDCWLQVDYDEPAESMPADLWSQCQMLESMQLSWKNQVLETISGATLFALCSIRDIHNLILEPLSSQRTRFIVPLCFYWFSQNGQKLPVKTLISKYKIDLHVSSEQLPSCCSLTMTCWSLTVPERSKLLQPKEQIIVMHDSINFSVKNLASNFVHSQQLPFKNPTKDIIVIVRPRNEPLTEKPLSPVGLLEIILDGNICLSLNSIFSSKVIGKSLYHIDNGEFIYFLPFDIILKRSDAGGSQAASTCNFSLYKSVELRMTLAAGDYDVFVVARNINVLRFVEGEMALVYSMRDGGRDAVSPPRNALGHGLQMVRELFGRR